MSQTMAVDLVKQAIVLARIGEKTQARPLLRQAVVMDPTNESAWMWLAGVAETHQEALAALDRVLALNPGNERARSAAHAARLQLGVGAAKAGKKARARTLLRAVVAAEPANELAWMWLANVADSPADAASYLERVLAINPDNERARLTFERCSAAARAARPSNPTPPVAPSARLTAADDAAPRTEVHKTVLVVIDRQLARDQVAETLKRGGYEVRTAADGYEAVDLLRDRGAPDLILLASSLPGGMDGYQLCKLLRENGTTAHVPILLLTVNAGLFARMRGGMAGATAELASPFAPAELLGLAKQHCPLQEAAD